MASIGDELCSASLTAVDLSMGMKHNSRPGFAEQISTAIGGSESVVARWAAAALR
jgi:hypothetical protein